MEILNPNNEKKKHSIPGQLIFNLEKETNPLSVIKPRKRNTSIIDASGIYTKFESVFLSTEKYYKMSFVQI